MKKVIIIGGVGHGEKLATTKEILQAIAAHGISVNLVEKTNTGIRNTIINKEKLRTMKESNLSTMGMNQSYLMAMAEAMGANLNPSSTILPTKGTATRRMRTTSGINRKKVKAARKANVQRQIRAKRK